MSKMGWPKLFKVDTTAVGNLQKVKHYISIIFIYLPPPPPKQRLCKRIANEDSFLLLSQSILPYSDLKVNVHYNIIASLITLGLKVLKNTEQNKVLFNKWHNKKQLKKYWF